MNPVEIPTTFYTVELDLTVKTEASEEDFDAHTDLVLEHLCELDDVLQADMSASLVRRSVSFQVTVPADDHIKALDCAFAAVRTAIHAEGGATPGWEAALADAQANVTPSRREAVPC